ncbi:MAG: signal recognition particle protein [Planctomycetia bacterium]|nr:signal recognition particle protein [Planctomycetia bacterium]
MFESLQESLGNAIRNLTGRGKLTEANIREGMRLVQQSLLEADVSLPVVKDFVDKITQKSLGLQVEKVYNPTEQIVTIVHDELVNLMGPVDSRIPTKEPVTIIMLCGLQGSGKTTTCGKLGKRLKAAGRKPLFVAADLQRPAAIAQLEVLGEKVGVPVFSDRKCADPVDLCRRAVEHAIANENDVVLLDTAGRLHIDQELMDQLNRIERQLDPDQVYFVVDSMTGQDAVNSAKAFNETLELDGVILTKLDGDTRGGAALSVKAITGVPIKFIGSGETLEALEEFHPDRMAGRILGMGDLATLLETAREKFDAAELKRQQEQLEKGVFTLDDFRRQMQQANRLGSMHKIMSFIPGLGQLSKILGSMNVDPEGEMRRIGGIIDSMTKEERRNPKIIDYRRKRRIALGAGVEMHQINELLTMYEHMAAMVKSWSHMGIGEKMDNVRDMTQQVSQSPFSVLNPLQKKGPGTGKRLTAKERLAQKKRLEKERRKKKKGK